MTPEGLQCPSEAQHGASERAILVPEWLDYSGLPVYNLIMQKLTTKARTSRYEGYLSSIAHVHSVNKEQEGPPVNPFKYLRENPQSSKQPKTLQGLADAMQLSKQALIRAEQGVYTDPPERVLKYFLSHSDYDYPTLMNGYKTFQREMRERHSKLFGPSLQDLFDPTVHPLTTLLSNWTDPISGSLYEGSMNPTECAKLLCLSQSVLDHWLNKIKHQQKVPQPFTQAIREAGYSLKDSLALDNAYEDYRNQALGLTKVKLTSLKDQTTGVSFKDLLMDELFSPTTDISTDIDSGGVGNGH